MSPAKAPEKSRTHRLLAITDRAFAFAVRVVNLCKFLERNTRVGKTVINQLLDAATSVGANLEEAVAAQSTADFIHKNAVALKEAREANYWLRLINATNDFRPAVRAGILELESESMELARIIGKRIVTTRRNRR